MINPWQEILDGGSWSPYPWVFLTDDGSTLCEACAHENRPEVTDGGEVFEGSLYCDECGREIVGAYAEAEKSE